MAGLTFQLSLKPGEPGVLWAFWRIHTLRATGVLTVEWERFKKQIVFRAGEPVASRSNWPHETLSSFLVRRKIIDAQRLQSEMSEIQKLTPPPPLGEHLISKGIVASHDFNQLLEQHFRERVFNLVALSHGEVNFETYEELPLKDTDQTKLSGEFLRLLWEAARLHLDEPTARSRIPSILNRPVRVRGDCPFPVAPKELRQWNELTRDFKIPQSLDLDGLRLLSVATEFKLLELGESPADKLMKDLKALEVKFQNAKAHDILAVEEDSTPELCKKSYLDLVKKYHPDRLPSDASAELKKMSESIFAKINEAYSTMTDAEKRAEYQAKLELERSGGMKQIEKTLEAEMLIPQAKMAIKRRHFKAAHELLVKIVDVLPKDAELKADFAYVKLMQLIEAKIPYKERVRETIAELDKALSQRPQYGTGYYYRAMVWKLEGQNDRALEDFDRAIENDSSLQEAASEARIIRTRKDGDGKKGGGLFGKKR